MSAAGHHGNYGNAGAEVEGVLYQTRGRSWVVVLW